MNLKNLLSSPAHTVPIMAADGSKQLSLTMENKASCQNLYWSKQTSWQQRNCLTVNYDHRQKLELTGNRDGHSERKKKPEVKILGDYYWIKYNIFHPKQTWIRVKIWGRPTLKKNQMYLEKLKLYFLFPHNNLNFKIFYRNLSDSWCRFHHFKICWFMSQNAGSFCEIVKSN